MPASTAQPVVFSGDFIEIDGLNCSNEIQSWTLEITRDDVEIAPTFGSKWKGARSGAASAQITLTYKQNIDLEGTNLQSVVIAALLAEDSRVDFSAKVSPESEQYFTGSAVVSNTSVGGDSWTEGVVSSTWQCDGEVSYISDGS